MTKEIKLDPICFRGTHMMAITNTGYLLPCCYCDHPSTLEDIEFKKLLAVSKIEDYETIDEILSKKEWIDFEENLRNHKGAPACIEVCRVREDKNNIIRKDIWINLDDGTIDGVKNYV